MCYQDKTFLEGGGKSVIGRINNNGISKTTVLHQHTTVKHLKCCGVLGRKYYFRVLGLPKLFILLNTEVLPFSDCLGLGLRL